MYDREEYAGNSEIGQPSSWSGWSWSLAVGAPLLVYLAVVAARYDGLPFMRGDCQYYFYTSVSLLVDRDLDLANQLPPPLVRHSDDVALDTRGRLVPKHPIWMAVLALPFIGAFGAPGALLFNLLQLVLLLYLMARFAGRFASPRASSLAVALTGVASILPHYVWNFSPDVFSTLLLMAGLVALPAERSRSRQRHILAGVLLGFAAISKFSLFLAVPGVPLLCGRPYRRTLPALVAGFSVPVCIWLALNFHLFGSPLVTSYDRMARIDRNTVIVHSQRSDFGHPVQDGARDQLFDRVHGLLFTSPVTVLSLFGVYFLGRRDPKSSIYLAATFLAIFLFFSSYAQWRASFYGNRFLMPIIVLAAAPLASLLDAALFGRRSSSTTAVTRAAASSDPPPVREQGHEQARDRGA